MRFARLFVFLLLAATFALAQSPWQPAAGHRQEPIWPGAIPDPRPSTDPETAKASGPKDLVAGRPVTTVEHVSVPTLTVYAPTAANTGAAVIVFPGGGYSVLAIDLEGTEACDWLVTRGVTCFLLKYRVPAPRSAPYWGAYPQSPIALEDAQRAIGLVRHRAAELRIDPHKIVVLGFSAGGHLATAVSVHFDRRVYKPVDDADRASCRPDFAIAMYPGHLSWEQGTLKLNPDIASHITRQTPPTFLLQNQDDNVDTIWDAVSYHAALLRAGVPVEFHSYPLGGHAFGLRATKNASTHWPMLVEAWLHGIGMLPN